MKDAKLMLKEAREAIKNKNYEASAKLCKQILREESDNYMALVLLGVSFQETGQQTKALNTFQSAVKANPSNSLAWNGIINYYEKQNTEENKPNLVKAYISLLNIETNEKKLREFTQKLCDLAEYGDIEEIASVVYSLTKSEKCTDATELVTSLIDVLSKDKNLSPDLMKIYEDCLSIVIKNQKTVCVKYYADYLNVLYKLDKKDELYVNAKKMHTIFQSDWISLKWICKVFNENYVESEIMSEKAEEIMNYSEMLLKLESPSATAMLTKSILFIEEKKLSEAKELLEQAVKVLSGLLHAWILLLKCCVKLYLFTEATTAVNKIDKLLQSNNDVKQHLKDTVNVLMVEVLSRSDDKDDLNRCLQVYEMVNSEQKSSYISHIIRANISLKNFEQTKNLLKEFKKNSGDEITHKLLTAQLFFNEGQTNKALDILENENIETSEWWLQIGLIYWNIDQIEKSLMPFLKAAKLDNSNFRCFLLLGDYYKKVNDLNKARRCYEKSFKLNNRCSEAGIELSKIYRKIKSWDANLALLQSLTTGVINKKNSWAWLQLGLHFIEQQDYNKAIENLRFVIRIDENNMNCWESLADAYLAKGAYTSALKCYERVASSSDNILYSLLQMATIKQILGEFSEARADFEQILSSNGSYIPALKGIAETCLLQAKQSFREQRLGCCRDHAQCASNHLITALQQRSDLACLWKLLGDCCVLITNLPSVYSHLILPCSFVKNAEEEGTVKTEKIDLFTVAARCYYSSVNFVEDNILIWHDLAGCYLSHSMNTPDEKLVESLITKAQTVAKFCVAKNPTYWQHWNLLGNIAMNLKPPNFNLAQHSFIKAVISENNSAVAWANLGTLYFTLADYKLANKAYSRAQRGDPNYVASWIGQALLAEKLCHSDAMDLFRHSTQLGFHKQGALGYAHWVCKTLKQSPMDAVIYSIHNMHAIPVACDVLSWYTEHTPLDSTAWNMLGILKERMGLKSSALEAFGNALRLTEKNADLVRGNYGRMLTRMEKYPEAVDVFSKIGAATFNSGSGLALALFKDKNYKESYEAYESTLHWLSEEPHYQSDLLVALASMAYMFEGPEAAKTLLFQSIQLEKPSPWGFYACLSLGLLHKDFNLAGLVLKELEVFKDKKDCVPHFATLSSLFHLLKENGKASIREVSRIIHRHPDQASVWLTLSSLLLKLRKNLPASKCAQIAMKLSQNSMDATKILCIVALSFFVVGDTQKALCMAQKAVHCYPNLVEGWTVLIASLLNTKKLTISYIKAVSQFIEDLDRREVFINWIRKISCL